MKNNSKRVIAAKIFVAVAVLAGLGSCKGRTMENMEPTGDTVEVEINISGEEPAESLPAAAMPDQS